MYKYNVNKFPGMSKGPQQQHLQYLGQIMYRSKGTISWVVQIFRVFMWGPNRLISLWLYAWRSSSNLFINREQNERDENGQLDDTGGQSVPI